MGDSVLAGRGRHCGPVCLGIVLFALLCFVPRAAEAQDPFGVVRDITDTIRDSYDNFKDRIDSFKDSITPRFPRKRQTIRLHFDVRGLEYTVNGSTKVIATVNGLFPGPTIYAHEGDRIIVNVTNSLPRTDITIHFHGTRQERSPWMDGVAGITMCPIRPNDYFVHDFEIPRQKGTLLWHAHIGWMRATVHGAFITTPDEDPPYDTPFEEFPLVFTEWWNRDIEELELSTLRVGTPFPEPNAFLINGKAGPNYLHSDEEGTTTFYVIPGKTYLLRLINAAVNNHVFFGVGDHLLTVVAADGDYVQPFETDIAFLSPGQTVDVLLTCDQKPGKYYLSLSAYGRGTVPNSAALLQYTTPKAFLSPAPPTARVLPLKNATGYFEEFMNSLKTTNVGRVPLNVDTNLFFTVGLSTRICNNTGGDNCTRFTDDGSVYYGWQGHVNNYTLLPPSSVSLMQALWFGVPNIFTEDFPTSPRPIWNYLGLNASALRYADMVSAVATKVVPIKFNSTVQIILQDTNILGVENHPFHLHGHNFYVLGQGYGNYDPSNDSPQFNLWDPPLRNTVAVPTGGWAAIRLKANNPGMWLFHCHLDKHSSWGMMAVLNVHNATDEAHAMHPPPARLVSC